MKSATWNGNGIRARKDEVVTLIQDQQQHLRSNPGRHRSADRRDDAGEHQHGDHPGDHREQLPHGLEQRDR
jgi:hypothetical protein